MAVQYWVGDFFVDLSRNQITQKERSQTVAPKALAVLTYLAEHQGKVVSYDELFSNVWPDTVVTPNTLQRSIAQLRKLLGEDSKRQSFIKTHAKQGYSLECAVKWQGAEAVTKPKLEVGNAHSGDNAIAILSKPEATSTWATLGFKLMCAFAVVAMLGFIGVNGFSPEQPSKWSIGELRSLTATDNKEFGGGYSPDGRYVVFHRYAADPCINSNIWAKNTETQEEMRLTKDWGNYGAHSFSKDGKRLVFIQSERCDKPVTQKYCYKLLSLDFASALKNPQAPEVLLECKNSKITRPAWLNNNRIAFMQKLSDRWQLSSYSIEDNESTIIYAPHEGNIIDYDYSVTKDLIALTSVRDDDRLYIEMLKPDGQLVSSHPIEYPPEIPNRRLIYPNFTPQAKELIFSTGRQLFTLSYEGQINNISLPIDQPMGSPIFHPNGKQMLVIKGNFDSDIVTIPRAQLGLTPAGQILTQGDNHYAVVERSNLAERHALYQPDGELIAFHSSRSGEGQIWLSDGQRAWQLSRFPIDTFISGFDWADDGSRVLVNANNALVELSLDSEQKDYPFNYPVEKLFQWNDNDNTALLVARIRGVSKFIELDLNSSKFRVVTDKKVNWALRSDDGRLIYSDHLDQFWQPGPAEDRLIERLTDQGSRSQFIIKDDVIYGINEEFQLWSFDLNETTFTVLGNMPHNVERLSDINQTDVLFTLRISARKELAELTLAN